MLMLLNPIPFDDRVRNLHRGCHPGHACIWSARRSGTAAFAPSVRELAGKGSRARFDAGDARGGEPEAVEIVRQKY